MIEKPVLPTKDELALVGQVADNEVVSGGTERLSLVTRKSWHSAAIIHYCGNGLWSLGFAPIANSKWEWIQNINAQELMLALGGETNALIRCPTDKVKEILRAIP